MNRLLLPLAACAALLCACKPDLLPVPEIPVTGPNYGFYLKSTIDSVMQAEQVPGMAIGVVQKGRIDWTQGYGRANLQTGAAVDANTRFMLNQTADPVVAAAVLQALQETGKSLDDPISSFLPFPVRHARYPQAVITLRMLLSHTSGIADDAALLAAQYTPGDPTVRVRDFLQSYLTPGRPLYAPGHYTTSRPGKTYRYARVNLALAGYCVEALTGVEFDLYCKTRLFIQLGYAGVSWYLYDLPASRLAAGYVYAGGVQTPVPAQNYPFYPSGALRIHIENLSRFTLAMLQQGIYGDVAVLSPAQTQDLLTVQYPVIDGSQALGFQADTLAGLPVYGMLGGELGFSSCLYLEPGRSRGVAILCNGACSADALRLLAARCLRTTERF
ncbi:MAG: serine hydrolase domain-containing protein [Bacteroidia bacterium]|nr:serine hydrolase domain-containing protein [Bacteroidia bacterium]